MKQSQLSPKNLSKKIQSMSKVKSKEGFSKDSRNSKESRNKRKRRKRRKKNKKKKDRKKTMIHMGILLISAMQMDDFNGVYCFFIHKNMRDLSKFWKLLNEK
jgi:cation transport ATPase